jgi:DnaJ like chaperone protein
MASWNGKIIGAVLGALAGGGPVGAVIGLVLGHQYDTYAAQQPSPVGVAQIQALFFPATFRLMGHIAKADGRVSEQEISAARALMHSLRLNEPQMRQAMDCYTQGKQPGFSVNDELRALRDAMARHPQMAQFFIELQLQTAIAGNGLSAAPRERLQFAANYLGVPPAHFARLETIMRWRQQAPGAGGYGAGYGASGSRAADPDRLNQAYTLLEVSSTAADDQVVKAYRRQMSRHHPDKLQANGLPESMLERAKERTQQIQAAYELIRATRGMS